MALSLLRSWTSANYYPAIYRSLHQTGGYTRLSNRGGCRSDKLLEEQDVSGWAADQRGSRVHYSLTALRTTIAETQSSLNLHTRHKHTLVSDVFEKWVFLMEVNSLTHLIWSASSPSEWLEPRWWEKRTVFHPHLQTAAPLRTLSHCSCNSDEHILWTSKRTTILQFSHVIFLVQLILSAQKIEWKVELIIEHECENVSGHLVLRGFCRLDHMWMMLNTGVNGA